MNDNFYNFYFPHNGSLRNDPRIIDLIQNEGMAGYGIYMIMLEHLHLQESYIARLNLLHDIARRCCSNRRKIRRILMDYDLFVVTESTFYSPDLCQRMKPFETKFRKTLNKRSGAKEDKSLKTNDEENAPNNINKTKREKIKIIKKTSPSNEVEVQKRAFSCKASVAEGEKEKEVLKPVVSNQLHSQTSASGSTDCRTQPPAPAQEAAPAPATGWESWIDRLKDETRWKELMSRHSRLTGYFFTFYDRLMTLFKEHIVSVGKENTIRCLSDAKRYFCCFCDPERYTGKRLYARIQAEIRRWREVYIHEEYNATTGRRTYWGGRPIPADAPPRPHDRARWDTQTASWQ